MTPLGRSVMALGAALAATVGVVAAWPAPSEPEPMFGGIVVCTREGQEPPADGVSHDASGRWLVIWRECNGPGGAPEGWPPGAQPPHDLPPVDVEILPPGP